MDAPDGGPALFGGLGLYVCARVARYRKLARELVRPEHVVIEVGAAEGHTTQYLAARAGRVIAIEKTTQCIQRAQKRCANQGDITWLQVDAYELGQVRKATDRADMVFIDIGGSTRGWRVVKLAGMYRQMFRPSAMVLRNVGLNDLVAAVRGCELGAPAGHWREPHRDT